MKQRSPSRLLLLVLLALLGACGLEGGAVQPTPPPAVPTPTQAPTADPKNQGWIVGLTEEPLDLYPYSYAARTASALLELLYPAPLQIVNEAYTTTGVLERVPSFENGDVAYVNTSAYLDPTGAITQTKTDVITSVRQLTVTYRWNKNLRWSDGTPLTAQDSVFAYNLLKGSASTPQIAIQSDLTADYVTIDDHTTKAYLPPLRDEPNYLETVWIPLPRHKFAEDTTAQAVNDTLARQPLGYGLYRLEAWIEGRELNFIRSDTALDPAIPAKLTVRLYPDLSTLRDDVLSSRVDVAWTEQMPDTIAASLQADTRAKTLQSWMIPTPIWEHIDMNLAVVALQDIRMRHALAYGFDRAGLSTSIYGADQAVWDSWIAPTSWAYGGTAISRYTYDPDKARGLLDEMGYTDTDGDGLRENPAGALFALKLVTSEQTALREIISDRFIANMADIGLRIELETVPTQDLYSQQGPLFQRRFELALFGWLRALDPDGAVLWSCAAIPNQVNNFTGDNFTGWCIDTADQAIRTATGSLDQTVRKNAYIEHQQIFTRELPILPVITRQMTVLARPSIQGLQPETFAPPTWNIQHWQR
ncbi:MAG: peptide ABC transporter substrate-binding protein [Herpetosiphonaceae bacterium]|nr:peptide ABC transporter substrate-binding protein [Herpetosiphonaceae bacterium]